MFEVKNIIGEMLKEISMKIKDETLEEYLNSFKKDDLVRLVAVPLLVKKDASVIVKTLELSERSKSDVKKYILNNYDELIKNVLEVIDTKNFLKLVHIVNNQKKGDYSIDLDVNLILNIVKFNLGKIEYKNNEIKCFIPKEFVKSLLKHFKDKKLIERNKRLYEIIDYTFDAINVYGVIPLSKVHEFFESQMYKIDETELFDAVNISISVNENMYIVEYEEDYLIANMNMCCGDCICEFYESSQGSYKKYSKKDMKAISCGSYLDNLPSYKKFKNFLKSDYNITNKDEIEMIKSLLVFDYIYTAQEDLEQADYNFGDKIFDFFNVDEMELKELRKYVYNIYKDYPKWSKRGNV